MNRYFITIVFLTQIGFSQESVISNKILSTSQQYKEILHYASDFLGRSYGLGQKTDRKIDCSGFVQEVYNHFNFRLPRSVFEQSRIGKKVAFEDIHEGDLLFFCKSPNTTPSHVAIYAGNRKIIHASYTAKCVNIDSIDKAFYKKHFLFAKRLIPQTKVEIMTSRQLKTAPNVEPKYVSRTFGEPVRHFRNYQIFDGREITISKEGIGYLDQWVRNFKMSGYSMVTINVYTDNVPPEIMKQRYPNNLILSQARAKSIELFLISRGIDETRIQINGLGDSNPIAPNDTEENRSKNRRIEFIF